MLLTLVYYIDDLSILNVKYKKISDRRVRFDWHM